MVAARKTSAKKKTPRPRSGPAVAAAEPAMTGGGMFDTQPTSGWGEGGQGYLSDDEDVGPPLDADDEQ
jgi:hypothetical protein